MFIVYFIFSTNISKNILHLLFSLIFNSTSFTFRCIIRKICIKENLKFSFSSQKCKKSEVSMIKNQCTMAHLKKKKCCAKNALETEELCVSYKKEDVTSSYPLFARYKLNPFK